MSISEKLVEFTKSLNHTDESALDRYLRLEDERYGYAKADKDLANMSMADRMSMGMGALGTLYASSGEQEGVPMQGRRGKGTKRCG